MVHAAPAEHRHPRGYLGHVTTASRCALHAPDGPLDPGPVTERVGPLGFVWTWTVVPAIEDFHVWTFYADGLRPCITSGFNAYQPLGSTATPTVTPIPTNTPGQYADANADDRAGADA